MKQVSQVSINLCTQQQLLREGGSLGSRLRESYKDLSGNQHDHAVQLSVCKLFLLSAAFSATLYTITFLNAGVHAYQY